MSSVAPVRLMAHAVARLLSVALFMGGPPATHSDGPSTRTDLAMFLFLARAKPKDRLCAGTCLGKIGTMMGFHAIRRRFGTNPLSVIVSGFQAWSCVMKDQDRINEAVVRAQKVLGEYIEPGPRDCEQTINNLFDVLDDQKVADAVERSYALKLAGGEDNLSEAERKHIQEKQGGHHYPSRPDDSPPMDDTDPQIPIRSSSHRGASLRSTLGREPAR
jgi:hypothetical protein